MEPWNYVPRWNFDRQLRSHLQSQIDPKGDFHQGCWNASRYQQSFSGLLSPGRSNSIEIYCPVNQIFKINPQFCNYWPQHHQPFCDPYGIHNLTREKVRLQLHTATDTSTQNCEIVVYLPHWQMIPCMASVMPMTCAMCREFFLVSSLICHTSRGPIISLNFRSKLDQISIRWPQGYFQGTGHSSPHLESRKDNTRIYLRYQPRWIHWMGQADFFFRRSGRLFDRERSFIDDTCTKERNRTRFKTGIPMLFDIFFSFICPIACWHGKVSKISGHSWSNVGQCYPTDKSLACRYVLSKLTELSSIIVVYPIGHSEKYHNTICLSPQILHKHCYQFLLGLTMVPRENKNNAYVKLWGTNKEYYVFFSEMANGCYYPAFE